MPHKDPDKRRESAKKRQRRHREKASTRAREKAARAAKAQYYRDHPREWLAYTIKRYGLTLDDYDALLEAQEGRCAVCRRDRCQTGDRLGVDHCHETNRVRGLLCRRCNSGIGMLGDTTEGVAAALRYLRGE